MLTSIMLWCPPPRALVAMLTQYHAVVPLPAPATTTRRPAPPSPLTPSSDDPSWREPGGRPILIGNQFSRLVNTNRLASRLRSQGRPTGASSFEGRFQPPARPIWQTAPTPSRSWCPSRAPCRHPRLVSIRPEVV